MKNSSIIPRTEFMQHAFSPRDIMRKAMLEMRWNMFSRRDDCGRLRSSRPASFTARRPQRVFLTDWSAGQARSDGARETRWVSVGQATGSAARWRYDTCVCARGDCRTVWRGSHSADTDARVLSPRTRIPRVASASTSSGTACHSVDSCTGSPAWCARTSGLDPS